MIVREIAEYLLLAILYGYTRHPWERAARRAETTTSPENAP